jgi:hypothetical protein
VGLRTVLDDVEKKNSCPYRDMNSDPSVVQPVASRYTDCAIPAPNIEHVIIKKYKITALPTWDTESTLSQFIFLQNCRCEHLGISYTNISLIQNENVRYSVTLIFALKWNEELKHCSIIDYEQK